MSVIKPERIKELETDIKLNFQKGQESKKVDKSHERFTMVVPSNSGSNTYQWLGEMPNVDKWVGPRKLSNVQMFAYEVHNESWQSAISVTEMDIMNNQLAGKYINAQALGQKIMSHPAKLSFEALAKGHLNVCHDGQNFFDKEHPVYANTDGTGEVANVSNNDEGSDPNALAWFLLDTRDIIQPIVFQPRTGVRFMTNGRTDGSDPFFMEKIIKFGADYYGNVGYGLWCKAYRSTQPLTAENIKKAYLEMTNWKANGGENLEVSPDLLVIPSLLKFDAAKILKSKLIEGSDNTLYDLLEVLESPKLNTVPKA